ncbi:MAG: Ig-like domain-containing protein [Tannerella sp.]|jgi:hypothetical protein|nr:Ig-like domain-containing protein [Tannerella sp.]
MKTRFLILCISILITGGFFSGCEEESKKDALEKYIYVNKKALNIFFGDKVQLTANPVGETFEWTSANPAVATVTSDGLVEAVSTGSTEITVGQGTSRTSVPVTVTLPVADKVVVAGDNEQFQIAVQTLSERITTVRIIWNNNSDSTDIAINNQRGVFTRTVNYSGENGYIFHAVSFDRFGNRSVSSEVTATLLRNRDVSTARAMDNGSLTVQWGNNVSYVEHCKLSYINHNGLTVSKKIPPSETTTVINDYSADLSYTTLFVLIPSTTDTFRVETVAPAVVESLPFNGPHILSSAAPCEIQAMDFDYGGEGLAFHETDNTLYNNSYSSYRTGAGDDKSAANVDIEDGGNLGWVAVGEWLVYTIEVQDAGVYAVDVSLSVNNGSGGSFYFSIDGNRSETTVAPNQNSWNSWIWVFERYPDFTQPTFRLSAGKHKFRFTVEPGGFNLMGYKFIRIGE